MSELLLRVERWEEVRARLASCPALARFGPKEAATLIHAFSDLEESMRAFLDEQLPKLADPAVKGEELEDLLLDIREEFQLAGGPHVAAGSFGCPTFAPA